MLTFYDEKGNGYGAQVEFTTKNAVNGERSVSGTILSNDKVLSRVDRGWSFEWDGETYKIIYAKPKDEGRSLSVSFDAVHQFFYDFDHSNCYEVFNGSNRFEVYIEAIFKNSGYRYVIEAEAKAIRKENFGNAKRLSMFKDIIKAAGLEFSVTGKVVRIVKKVGTDLSTVVRKNFNMNELTLEKNIGAFITYKKGFGAWKNEENHDAGRYETEYESPLARVYGRIEGEPISDERYKDTGKLLERIKHDVDNSYSISVQLEMEDLTRAGYKYTQPRAGDYIMAINETIGFREKIRIVSYESHYDVTGRLLSHKVTCNDIGTVQKAISSEGSIMRSVGQSKEYAESALAIATQALVSADGKTTTYYGAEKPRDQPRGTLHRGDLLYLTVGEETELYFWNGSEWELKHLKFDSSKFKKMLEDSKASTDKAIAQANQKADEALKKAGTLPDTTKLSDQIKQQILSSQDLNQKVTETLNQTESGVIYNKILQNVKTDFVPKKTFDDFKGSASADLNYLTQQSQDHQIKISRQTVEFQKLTETTKLYERIIGTSETDAPDKLSRLVMSSEIFQTEVGKYATSGGPNMLRNSRADDGLNYWTEANGRLSFTSHQFYLNGQKRMFLLSNGSFVHSPRFIIKQNTNYMLNLTAFDANTSRFKIIFCKRRKGSTNDFDEMQTIFDKTGSPAFNSDRAVKKSFSFNTGMFDEGYLLFNYQGNPSGWSGLFMTELDFYEGSSDRLWQPSPEDSTESVEAVRTQVTQLAGSWSVRNLNSNGDVLNSINLLANGTNRIDGRLTHITGQTVIDNAVIKDGMIEKVSANKLTAGTIDAREINLINLNAKSITSGTFKGLTFEGGIIRGNNGNTVINLNSNVTTYNGTARIEFKSSQNSLEFNSGGRKAFLSPTVSSGTNYGAFAFGVNDRGEMDPDANFTGIKIFNQPGHRSVVLIGDVYIVKNSISRNAPGVTLAQLFNLINENFIGIENWFKRNNLGAPGRYPISI
jgi:reticulocyte binding protein (fragment)